MVLWSESEEDFHTLDITGRMLSLGPGLVIGTRRNWEFWENIGYAISKVNNLQKCYEIAKFDVFQINYMCV